MAQLNNPNLDCVVIGYNDPPFEAYEGLLRRYGEDSEAYRDLKLSFVNVDGAKLTYVELLNYVLARAGHGNSLASGEIPNLAAAYLTNFLRRQGYRADYVNLFQQEKERLGQLLDEGVRTVAITTTFYVINYPVHEMVEFIREHAPETQIVLGGPLIANHFRNYSGADLEATLDDLGADVYVHEGQGEATLAQILAALDNGGDLSKVSNIAFKRGGASGNGSSAAGKYELTAKVPENNDMNAVEIDWLGLSGGHLGATLQTRTARSCAFNCAFCNYPTRAGKLTLASVDTIERELDSMAARGGVENVVFIDDTFNVPLPRFKDICRLMIRKNYGFNWFSYFRCSNSDDEAFELMAQAGCKGVFLGIESGSPTVLTHMNKHATIEKYRRGIQQLHKNGVLTFGSFILGFPGETQETVQETIDFLHETKPSYFRSQMWYNEAGTPIHQKADEYGIDGDGFVWEHNTMDSLEAMEHIERLVLTMEDSEWLPQWSFDFWIIPYLMGKGITLEQFRRFMHTANRMLRLEIASVDPVEKARLQGDYLSTLVDEAKTWTLR